MSILIQICLVCFYLFWFILASLFLYNEHHGPFSLWLLENFLLYHLFWQFDHDMLWCGLPCSCAWTSLRFLVLSVYNSLYQTENFPAIVSWNIFSVPSSTVHIPVACIVGQLWSPVHFFKIFILVFLSWSSQFFFSLVLKLQPVPFSVFSFLISDTVLFIFNSWIWDFFSYLLDLYLPLRIYRI